MSSIEIDLKPTAEAMENAANRMRQSADELDRLAARMQERGDLSYASVGINVIVNCLSNCRLDLFVTRPIRALQN
jgi:tRNA(Ser,Leu) C12 N-acetylase TAN1